MTADETSTVGCTTEALLEKISALEARIVALEDEVKTEHEDIENLKSLTREDHARLESLKATKETARIPPPTVSPVGL